MCDTRSEYLTLAGRDRAVTCKGPTDLDTSEEMDTWVQQGVGNTCTSVDRFPPSQGEKNCCNMLRDGTTEEHYSTRN